MCFWYSLTPSCRRLAPAVLGRRERTLQTLTEVQPLFPTFGIEFTILFWILMYFRPERGKLKWQWVVMFTVSEGREKGSSELEVAENACLQSKCCSGKQCLWFWQMRGKEQLMVKQWSSAIVSLNSIVLLSQRLILVNERELRSYSSVWCFTETKKWKGAKGGNWIVLDFTQLWVQS